MVSKGTKTQRDLIVEKLGTSVDWYAQKLQIGGMTLELIALSSLVDIPATNLRLLKSGGEEAHTWEQLWAVIGAVEARGDLITGLLEGRTLLLMPDGTGGAWVQSEKRPLNRSINPPVNQNIMVSSKTAFIEDLITNLGLVRNELRSPALKQSIISVGSVYKKRILMLSMMNAAESAFVYDCEKALRAREGDDFDSLAQLMRWLGRKPVWNPIPSYARTESPHETANFLKKGRVVLLIEGYPDAIVIPVELSDLLISSEDRDYPAIAAAMLAAFRILGVLVAIAAPAAYVALVSINPDVMKVELIYSIAQSRVGVPYPSITEALILLFIMEMLLEAIIRLPKSIGPAMTMVGGIILGQAVVDANLVSNLLIIVLAASTIANFTVIGYNFALVIRMSKYFMLGFAALFGPLGIVCGFYLLLSLLCTATVMRKPFFPVKPLEQKE
ncbi:spore germination protein [Paenibacillus kobensis]|uniref:spore germination protein n=1 Tax=Paenibacillus kobensis TaxID=59841 RepID=UPI000FDBB89F|nr:spore germination protein [Paenibacillus kobensis]